MPINKPQPFTLQPSVFGVCLILAALLFFGWTLPQNAEAAITQEQTKTGVNLDTNSPAVTLDSAATAGNLIVSCIATDKNAGTYTAPTGFTIAEQVTGSSVSGAIAYKKADGGETTITWGTTSFTNGSAIWTAEYSDVNAFDVSAESDSGAGTGNSRTSGTTASTAKADSLAVACFGIDTASNFGGNLSFTNSFTHQFTDTVSGGSAGVSAAHKILSATGTQETTGSWTSNDQNYGHIAVFNFAVSPIVSADDQTFETGASSTAIETITITADGASAINTTDDIRVRIPSGFNMNWDESDTTATIGGDDSSKVSTTVSYEDSDQTLVIDVTTNFGDRDNITVSGLSFDTFSAASAADNLELELDNAGGTDGTDEKTITVVDGEITIASSTAQPGDAVIDTVDNVLGSASIVRNVGTGSVTAVVIKENGGTVEAGADLNNIELWLSSDDTWDALDEQLGSAGEFNGNDGTVTKTETFSVTTTTQYLIVRGDIDSTATAGETIEIQIESLTTTDTVSGDPLDISGTTTVANAGIAQVQTKEAGNISGTTPSVTLDTGAISGNLLVSCFANDKSAGTITVPSGWTLVNDYVSSNVSGAVAYKVSAGGETSVQWTVTSANNGSSIWVGEYRDVNTLDVEAENDSGGSAVSSLATGTTGTTTANDALAIACLAIDSNDEFNASTVAWTNSFTAQYEDDSNTSAAGLAVSHKILTTTGTQTSTASSFGADQTYANISVFKDVTVTLRRKVFFP